MTRLIDRGSGERSRRTRPLALAAPLLAVVLAAAAPALGLAARKNRSLYTLRLYGPLSSALGGRYVYPPIIWIGCGAGGSAELQLDA